MVEQERRMCVGKTMKKFHTSVPYRVRSKFDCLLLHKRRDFMRMDMVKYCTSVQVYSVQLGQNVGVWFRKRIEYLGKKLEKCCRNVQCRVRPTNGGIILRKRDECTGKNMLTFCRSKQCIVRPTNDGNVCAREENMCGRFSALAQKCLTMCTQQEE
jgi:hypothetical protein